MKLEPYFKKFIVNISLNKTRTERILSAIDSWKEIFENDEEIGGKLKDFYTQGSFAIGTAIRPSKSKDFDVDAVLLLDIKNENPKEFFDWVVTRMNTKEKYKGRIRPKKRCIRVNYEDGFHVDIVPARTHYEDSILIPTKDKDKWVRTSSIGFKKWCDKVHIRNGGKFKGLTKIMKYWRDQKLGTDTAPKSILLTTLVGKHMLAKASYAETIIASIENLIRHLNELINDAGQNGEIVVENPSLEGENLAREWDKEKCRIFKDKLDRMLEKAIQAFEESDKEKSIEMWREIFGASFPSELDEGAKMAEDIASGRVFVDSTGLLNLDQRGTRIPEHRFHGKE